MGGKFTNTTYTDTYNSLVDGFKDIIKSNPYAYLTDKKGTETVYWNQSEEDTTLDSAVENKYESIGNQSPTRFKKISNLFIYGLEKIMINIENGDFGLEADGIEGEAIILPNTIIPYPDDYFTITHIAENIGFKVITVMTDTLDNGANFYKIGYKLDSGAYKEKLDDQTIGDFTIIQNNVGTKFQSVVRSDVYTSIELLEDITSRLKTYYISLFYRERVQALVFKHGEAYFYDPYMVQFLIRNKILENPDEYIYITQQVPIKSQFQIFYDKTIFRAIESRSINLFKTASTNAVADYIDDIMSIFTTRIEDYFKVEYDNKAPALSGRMPIPCIDSELIEKIITNVHYDNDVLNNIIIKFINDTQFVITESDIAGIENIDYEHNIKLFYTIPIIIFIIESYITDLLKPIQKD